MVEIIKYLLPSVVVFLTSYFLLKIFLQNQQAKWKLDLEEALKKDQVLLKLKNQEYMTPVRLQAYERILLFLERISPASIIMRVNSPELNSFQLQMKLIETIRGEYEHNMAQQLYVSSNTWEEVKKAKEELVKLINISASQLSTNAKGSDLCTKIIEISSKDKLPTQKAIESIKEEVNKIF